VAVSQRLDLSDVRASWARAREILAKGESSSPGLPLAPPAPHKRAPRPRRAFYDPVEQASHPSAPEAVQPITLGDLKQLDQQTSYDKTPQRSTRVRTTQKVSSGSARIRQASLRVRKLAGANPARDMPYSFVIQRP
jgi:hypothetical protein